MKLFSLLSFLASLATGLALAPSLEFGAGLFTLAGIAMVLTLDYAPRGSLRFGRAHASALTAREVFARRAAGRRTFRAPALATAVAVPAESHRLAA